MKKVKMKLAPVEASLILDIVHAFDRTGPLAAFPLESILFIEWGESVRVQLEVGIKKGYTLRFSQAVAVYRILMRMDFGHVPEVHPIRQSITAQLEPTVRGYVKYL